MKRVVIVMLFFGGISFHSAMGTQQMAIWDFGPNAAGYTTAPTAENVIGTPTLVLSGGTLDPDGKDGIAYVDALGVSHIKGQAGAWDELKVSGDNARWIVTINTVGWTDLNVRFDYKAWKTSTNSFDMDYRLSDLDLWTNIVNDTPITGDETFHTFAYSLAGISSINNQSVVQFRFNDFDKNGNGKLAFDNFELTGTLVPEPATILLLGLGIAAVRRNHRK